MASVMRVYVPIWDRAQNVAELVLSAEGVPYVTLYADGDLGYSALMSEVWARGEGFIVVEHDVAPWVGALAQLNACPSDWCMYRYPEGGKLTRGLGCTKFSDRVVREHPDLKDSWAGVEWQQLDGAIGAAVAEVVGIPCYHTPSVAHARRPD